MTEMLTEIDEDLLRRAFQLAQQARERGDRPFGTVVAAPGGRILAEGNSTQDASGDGVLAHSEMNTLSALHRAGVPRAALANATIYCSGEPCPMCASAIFFTGVGRVVYGLSIGAILHLRNARQETAGMSLTCRAVLHSAPNPPVVIGPCLEDEASVAHRDYWVAAVPPR